MRAIPDLYQFPTFQELAKYRDKRAKENKKFLPFLASDYNRLILRKNIPVGVYELVRDFGRNDNVKQAMYFVIRFIYINTFHPDDIRIPRNKLAKTYKISNTTASKLLKHLRKIKLIRKIYPGSSYNKMAAIYKINYKLIRDAYLSDNRFYRNYESATRRKVFPNHPSSDIDDEELSKYLISNHYQFDKQKAIQYVISDTHHEEKQKHWIAICFMPEGKQSTNWHISEKNGRIYSREPSIQNIMKDFRHPSIITNNQKDCYEIDFSSQYFNLYTIFTKGRVYEDIWGILERETEYKKKTIKPVINAFFMGQHKGQGINMLKEKYGYNLKEAKYIYEKIMNCLKEQYKIKLEHIGVNYPLLTSALFYSILFEMARSRIELVIPLHDGVVIQGTEYDAKRTKEIFEIKSYEFFEHKLPVKLRKIFVDDEFSSLFDDDDIELSNISDNSTDKKLT